MRVKYDVTNRAGLVIIPAQTFVEPEHLELLERHRVDPYSIIFAGESQVSPEPPPSAAPSVCSELFHKTVEESRELFESVRKSGKVPLLEIRKEIAPMVQETAFHSDVFELLEAVKAKDDYTHRHHIGVGVISTLIGKWMGMEEPDLSALTLAATLHDIGKLKIPSHILDKPEKLTPDEYKLVQKHTVHGYELLKNTVGVQHRVALVALQHHEREDGAGYPLKLGSGQIGLFSKIVAVADIFHAMSSKRPYHDPIPFYQIMNQMRDGKFGELEPNIVSLFLNQMTRRLVGTKVILTDGRQGEVVYINPSDTETTLIKVDNEYIDLSKERHLQIKEIAAI